jgi:cyclopropane fatty-acyl-phospholipid synthase-like methyltransferase
MKEYYKAYDDRYRQVHEKDLIWFHEAQTPIVKDVIDRYGIRKEDPILEIGCGEGRDAFPLLRDGYSLLATDVSPEAVSFCKERFPAHRDRFAVLDCVTDTLPQKFRMIYAVAVLHMLTEDEDRRAFFRFLHSHLAKDGIALLCSMGDGASERRTDPALAFDQETRTHEQTGTELSIAKTTFRMVPFSRLREEIEEGGLSVMEMKLTDGRPDYFSLMYAVCKA